MYLPRVVNSIISIRNLETPESPYYLTPGFTKFILTVWNNSSFIDQKALEIEDHNDFKQILPTHPIVY